MTALARTTALMFAFFAISSCSAEPTADMSITPPGSNTPETFVPSTSATTQLTSGTTPLSTNTAALTEPRSEPCDHITEIVSPIRGTLSSGDNVDGGTVAKITGYTQRHKDTFGGKWIDRTTGTFAVAFTDDVAEHQAAIDKSMGDDPSVIVVAIEVQYTEAQLRTTTNELRETIGEWDGLVGVNTSITKNRVVAVLDVEAAGDVSTTIAQLPAWACHVVIDNRPPEGLAADGVELGEVNIAIDPEILPTRDSTSLALVLTEVDCAAGRPMDARLRAPVIHETPDVIEIGFWVVTQPAQVCRDRHETRVTIQLDDPVGDREIRGRGGRPLRASPVERQQNLFFHTLIEILEQSWTLGYDNLPVTSRSATSETFPIAQDGTPKFEISVAFGQQEPSGEWGSNEVQPTENRSIERLSGSGVWGVCGDIYLEVLSLDQDAGAADTIFNSLSRSMQACR